MLKGDKVALRAIERVDLAQLLEWRNNAELRQYFREYRELNQYNQEKWFETKVVNDINTIMFAIEDYKVQKLLGACGICYIDWINRNADFSIYIGFQDLYIDKHYALDAAKMLINYAFSELNLHRLWCEIYEFDFKKKEMLERVGFQLDGRHRQTHWSHGKWSDSLFYSLLSSDPIPS
ncbi:GNAT family protein [Paenibacillus sp. FSL M7-0802]|uniref:GNAT family N-acetyltransferase n=1 Tax=Paenibacillus TaxID=44249 RepID=UPI0003D3963C|nr:GNAT family protein [Paenibacillus polymyxa]AIW41940.1 acetyltransferase [Paenibacillus polymyxa CR1]